MAEAEILELPATTYSAFNDLWQQRLLCDVTLYLPSGGCPCMRDHAKIVTLSTSSGACGMGTLSRCSSSISCTFVSTSAAGAEGSTTRAAQSHGCSRDSAGEDQRLHSSEHCQNLAQPGRGCSYCDSCYLPAHRLVLAAGSGYFRALFTGAGRCMHGVGSGDSSVVEVAGFDKDSLRETITALYTNRLQVSPANLERLLHASSYLEAPAVLESCCQYMRHQLSVHTCVALLTLAARYGCVALHAELVVYLSSKFGCLVACTAAESSLCRLPPELLFEVLSSEELAVGCEGEVVEALVDWLTADLSGRLLEMPRLLSAVRLDSLPHPLQLQPRSLEHVTAARHVLAGLAGLQCVGARTLHAQYEGSGCESRCSRAHTTPGHISLFVTAGTQSQAQSRRRHQPTCLMAAGGHDGSWRSLRSVELYDPATDVWTSGPSLPQGVSFAGCTVLSGQVILLSGSPLWSHVSALAPGKEQWEAWPSTSLPRAHAGVATLAGLLYVVGGRSQVAQVQHVLSSGEFYDPHKRLWQRLPDLHVQRSALASVAHGSCVYAIGGAGLKAPYRTIEMFDTGSEAWHTLGSQLHIERKYTAAGVLGGRLFVVGGVNEGRTRLASVEALDPREGTWQRLPDMSTARSSCGAAAVGGKLYVVAGQSGDEGVRSAVEAWVPTAGRWLACTPLGCGRSGLGLCAL